MMKLYFLTVLGILLGITKAPAQGYESYTLPTWALKTNALYWGTTTPNLALEAGLHPQLTLDLLGTYNPWQFSGNKKLKHWLVQPELRYWTCERFNGHFFGIHGHYAQYNVGGIKMLGLKDHRYQGNLWGAGISYGYQWILSNRLNLEATLGLGYAHLKYDKYDKETCGRFIKDGRKNYFCPTKIGVSLVYFLK